jgi:hypothetical protein
MTAPTGWLDIIVLPAILVFFGLLWWFVSLNAERQSGRTTFWKWVALLPLGFALFVGIRYMWYMYNPDTGFLYVRSMMVGDRMNRRTYYSHFVSLAMPILAIAGVFLTSRFERRRRTREAEETY